MWYAIGIWAALAILVLILFRGASIRNEKWDRSNGTYKG